MLEQNEAQERIKKENIKAMTEQVKDLDTELKELQALLFEKTAKQAQDANVKALYKELIEEAEVIKIACENIIDLTKCAEEYGFKIGFIDSIKMCAQDIHNAHSHIIGEGRLQNAGFFNTRWDFQYNRIKDFALFLSAWIKVAKSTRVGNDEDSAFKDVMLHYIQNSAERTSKEADSLIYFCNRYEPFDFDRKGDK